MKTNFEKPVTLTESLRKKKVLDGEILLEKKTRAKKKAAETALTKPTILSEQESRLIEQDKEQEKKIAKQSRSRARTKIIPQPEAFMTTPVDEQENDLHIQETPLSSIPENIPVEAENFDDVSFEDIINKKERDTKKSERAKTEALLKSGIPHLDEDLDNAGLKELLGIESEEMSYDEIAESIKKFAESGDITEIEPEETTSLPAPTRDIDPITQNPRRESMSLSKRKYANTSHTDDWVNNIKPSKKSPEGIFREQWQDNPSLKKRHFIEHADGTEDLMRVYKDGTVDYSNANPFKGYTGSSIDRLSKADKKAQEKPWFSRLKHFLTINPKKIRDFVAGLQVEAKSVAEEFGWDEESELKKQAQQYQENLKNHELHVQEAAKILPPKGSEFVDNNWIGKEKRPYSKDDYGEVA